LHDQTSCGPGLCSAALAACRRLCACGSGGKASHPNRAPSALQADPLPPRKRVRRPLPERARRKPSRTAWLSYSPNV